MEGRARSRNIHLNMLENSSKTDDISTLFERVHCMSNRIYFQTHTHTPCYTVVKFKNKMDEEKTLKLLEGKEKHIKKSAYKMKEISIRLPSSCQSQQ